MLEANANATPITYLGRKTGEQFVAIATGGGGYFPGKVSDAVEAFALPDELSGSGRGAVGCARKTSALTRFPSRLSRK